ncbi:MAG: carboxylesterase, partial [bacterium]|nr:carboxylesterase [bacterium]
MKGVEEIFINKNSKIGVLMLHGFTSTPRQFKELSLYLSEKGYNVLAPLIAGHGTSPKDLMENSPKEWTESAKKAYFKLKGISEKVFIVGNSF